MSINCFAPIPFHAFRIPGMQIVASWYRHLDAKDPQGAECGMTTGFERAGSPASQQA